MTIQDTVVELIAREAKRSIDEVTLDPPLDQLGIDSLKAIVILTELEDALGIEIPNEAIATIKKVSDIVAKVEELQLKKSSA